MEFLIDGVKVSFIGITDATENEAKKYVDYVNTYKEVDAPIETVKVTACNDGKFDVEYTLHDVPFERIRRITGYLSGGLDTWNDAKREEERDRVKHADFDKGADLNVTIASEDNCNKAKVD